MSEKYSFIDAEYVTLAGEAANAPNIVQMCHWLAVSKSGYYEWRSRPDSAAGKRRELLKMKIKAIFEANNEEYGYRRMHRALARGGEECCPELVRSVMRELGLEPCQPKPWRHSLTEQDGQAGPIPDLVNRDFTAEKPGEKMVGDITYIETWEGWLYLATVIDCATRKMVGWAMDDNYKTPLITRDQDGGPQRRPPGRSDIPQRPRQQLHVGEFAKELEELGIRQSVGRTGICYDNALAEIVQRNTQGRAGLPDRVPTREKARNDIARWIELRYNRTRLHSGLGYRTPQEVLDEYLKGQQAA